MSLRSRIARSAYARIIGILALGTITGAVTCPGSGQDRVPSGSWGGDHIGLVVTDTGATIEYDCAMGTITEPLRLDAAGDFDWRGVHYPGHGGPVRVDEPRNAHAARYTGNASAEDMTITLSLTDTVVPTQTFTLRRGANAHVFKCL